MNKNCEKSSEYSSGFDEQLDDDLFDFDAPIRPNVEPGEQVYTSQLSFAISFGKMPPTQDLSFGSSGSDSGLHFSMDSIEPLSPMNSIFNAHSLPITFATQNLSQPIVEQNETNSQSNGIQTTTESAEETNSSLGNSSNECEIMDSEENVPDSGEELFDEMKFLSCIPSSILSLYRQIHEKCSDYSFAYAIAAQMCHRTFPTDCYHSVKLGLMLSIISTHSHEMRPISIMAIGRDGITMSTLMNEFRVYAQRFYTPSGDLKIVKSHQNGTFVEANSLLMATNGICFIGDWSSYNSSCSAYVRNVLDSGQIVVDAQTNINFPLKCAIWSYWYCCGGRKAIENVMMFSNVFGIPAVFEENQTDSLIDRILAAGGTHDELPHDDNAELHIDVDDMKTFFYFIGQRPVQFSDEAELLIKEYFMTSRLNRATLLSQRALRILRQMSACHAKLCLRDFVHRNDVIACIVLCEKFIFQIHGIEKSNAPFLGPIQHIFEVELYMQAFEQWLNSNLGVYGRRAGID